MKLDEKDRLILDKPTWDLIVSVNTQINKQIKYKTDTELYGKPDFWTIAENAGDCDDYALTKRFLLKKSGIPSACLRLATAFVESPKGPGTGGYHCVLLIETDRGTFCLDNRYSVINNFKKLPYRWALIQAKNSMIWQKIKN